MKRWIDRFARCVAAVLAASALAVPDAPGTPPAGPGVDLEVIAKGYPHLPRLPEGCGAESIVTFLSPKEEERLVLNTFTGARGLLAPSHVATTKAVTDPVSATHLAILRQWTANWDPLIQSLRLRRDESSWQNMRGPDYSLFRSNECFERARARAKVAWADRQPQAAVDALVAALDILEGRQAVAFHPWDIEHIRRDIIRLQDDLLVVMAAAPAQAMPTQRHVLRAAQSNHWGRSVLHLLAYNWSTCDSRPMSEQLAEMKKEQRHSAIKYAPRPEELDMILNVARASDHEKPSVQEYFAANYHHVAREIQKGPEACLRVLLGRDTPEACGLPASSPANGPYAHPAHFPATLQTSIIRTQEAELLFWRSLDLEKQTTSQQLRWAAAACHAHRALTGKWPGNMQDMVDSGLLTGVPRHFATGKPMLLTVVSDTVPGPPPAKGIGLIQKGGKVVSADEVVKTPKPKRSLHVAFANEPHLPDRTQRVAPLP